MVNPYRPEPAEILAVQRETCDTTTYTLAFTEPERRAGYHFVPGQFNMLGLFGLGEAPISVSSGVDEPEVFQHTIRRVGRVTQGIGKLGAGDLLWVRGPYGTGWPMAEMAGRRVLIIAGGIGLAPLRPVIYHLISHLGEYQGVEILYGARTPADMLYTHEFDRWRKSNKLKLHLTVDRVPNGEKWEHQTGVVTGLFDRIEGKPDDTVVITCGPEIMMRFVVQGLRDNGFGDGQIYVSLERRMSCGIGKCGKCRIGPMLVCRDGPVFVYAGLNALPELVLA